MAIKDDTPILVKNRKNGETGYTLDNNFHREFSYMEEKKVPFSELRELSYAPGGQYILDNYLIIQDEEALSLLNMNVEPEYTYTEKEIRNVLFNGSIDEFADFLDFAPEGAIGIAKDIAVKEEIPDTRKREMLSKRTGLNIDNAIMVNRIMDEETEPVAEAPKQRRVEPTATKTETKTRKAAPPKYNVVSKG